MARTLILMRHAEAGNGYRDHDRPLTPTGTEDAVAAGGWIRETLPDIDAVVCSTATRTRQTLAALGLNAPTRYADELYGGDVEDILGQIALTPGSATTLLVLGHAPGIPATAHGLASAVQATQVGDEAGTDLPLPDGDATNTDQPLGGGDPADGEPPEPAGLAGLRHFSACAIAVLQTDGGWTDLDTLGARLQSVRHPWD